MLPTYYVSENPDNIPSIRLYDGDFLDFHDNVGKAGGLS